MNVNADDVERRTGHQKSLCIVACGVAGSGKSTLLNGLCGEEVFKVDHLESGTVTVKRRSISKDLILCEIPGFEDESGNEDEYLEEIRRQCADVDVLIYCIPVNAARIKMGDNLSTLKKLHSSLDERVWNSCVIVLTFANALIDKIKVESLDNEAGAKSAEETMINQEYHQRTKEWKAKALETFTRAGINPDKMPIIEAGNIDNSLLFSTDKQPWLSTFFETVRDLSHPYGRDVLNNSCSEILSTHKEGKTIHKIARVATGVGIGAIIGASFGIPKLIGGLIGGVLGAAAAMLIQ